MLTKICPIKIANCNIIVLNRNITFKNRLRLNPLSIKIKISIIIGTYLELLFFKLRKKI